jgi:hypothetical protein
MVEKQMDASFNPMLIQQQCTLEALALAWYQLSGDVRCVRVGWSPWGGDVLSTEYFGHIHIFGGTIDISLNLVFARLVRFNLSMLLRSVEGCSCHPIYLISSENLS